MKCIQEDDIRSTRDYTEAGSLMLDMTMSCNKEEAIKWLTYFSSSNCNERLLQGFNNDARILVAKDLLTKLKGNITCHSKPRDLVIGDRVECNGASRTVLRMLHQDVYSDGIYDVEFMDGIGRYCHWKSEVDGGKVIYRDSIFEKEGTTEFCSRKSELEKFASGAVYEIPINIAALNQDISRAILNCISCRYVMTIRGSKYVLLDLSKDVKSATFLSNYKHYTCVERAAKNCNLPYYRTSVSLNDYYSKGHMQKYIDMAISLKDGVYSFGSILRWTTYGTLEFTLLRLE